MIESGKPDYTDLRFPPPRDDRPYVLINMVVSADGKAVLAGTERGLGSKTDQRLMRELRLNADVVLNGAGTLRANGSSSRLNDEGLERLRVSRGKPPAPIAAVLSGRGDLPLGRAFFTGRDFDAIVYLSDAAPLERRQDIAATGRPVQVVPGDDALRAMLRHMRQELGAAVLLVEGGPHLNGQFFAQGLVDEFYVTIGPIVVGGTGVLTAVEAPYAFTPETAPRLELVSAYLNPETSELYCRYRVRRAV
ncbi:MAG: hypothetical protein EXR43_04280 [Dehalococcoidia bacterium]|nr:hypothetical protein [Dehalococcoidia bacterium]